MRTRLLIVIAIAAVSVASPAPAGVLMLGSSLDEIVERQSAGMESAFLGPSIPGEQYGHSVAIHPFLGFYGNDGILTGLGRTWHTTRLLPWDAGVSVGVLDLDLTTWTIALSSGRWGGSDNGRRGAR